MATWKEFSDEVPELAAKVRARFEATKHHVLATLRADGSPRVSGTEVDVSGPDMTIGSMAGGRKAADLQRDARCAIHANPGDGSMDGGDAKVAGRAVQVAPEEFRLDLDEVVLISLNDARDRLVIELWRPGQGVQRTERV